MFPFVPQSASLAKPVELALQGREAIDEVEDHGNAVEVDPQVGAQAGDRNETRQAGRVESQIRARPLRRLDQAELDESLDELLAASLAGVALLALPPRLSVL